MGIIPDKDLWTICPVCQQVNPPGRKLCQHCWARLDSGQRVPPEHAEEISRKSLSRQKLRRRVALATKILVPLFLVAVVTLGSLYFFTDVIAGPNPSVNSSSLPGDWAMFRHDTSHSGATGNNETLPQGTLKWCFATGGAIHSSPAVANGTVYFGSRDGKLYALNAATGEKLWEYQTEGWVESSPAVVNGIVYFGSNDGRLYALNATSGEKLWDFRTRYAHRSSPAVANGTVYFGSDDNCIYALNAESGKRRWTYEIEGYATSSPVVANGIVYSGGGSQFCYALNAADGRLRLHYMTSQSVFSSPVVSGKTAYLLTSDGILYAIDGYAKNYPKEHDIRPIWLQMWRANFPVAPLPPQSGTLWWLKLGTSGSSSPSIANDTLYTGTGNNLVAVDLQNRQKLWEFVTGGTVISSPVVSNTTIYVGSQDGCLYAVRASTGEKIWEFKTGDRITSSPALADGTIYLASHDGNIYAIE